MDQERERQIGARLRAFRETLQIPRSRFAVTIGFGSERMASYEAGRAPLPYAVFLAVFAKYRLSGSWLAGENGPATWPENAQEVIKTVEYRPREKFSDVYRRSLNKLSAAFTSQTRHQLEDFVRFLEKAMKQIAAQYPRRASRADRLRLKELEGSFQQAIRSVESHKLQQEFLQSRAAEILSPGASDFTDSSTSGGGATTGAQWPRLKRRLQEATAGPGSKSRLAKFLGVDLTRVSQWLTEAGTAREPGAEYALQMLYWVDHPNERL